MYRPGMSTIDTFREMSGITETSRLHISPGRGQKIIDTVSTNREDKVTSLPVTLLPVATYVNESKEPDSGLAYVYPKQPPFAAHWGIVVDDLAGGDAFLLHLLLRGDSADREVEFAVTSVTERSKWIVGACVQPVGETKYPIRELRRIGREMIRAFGSYHLVFWNCQMFAKCYLRVITGNDAVFTRWTSADVTNLFLCALVVPIPIASTSKHREKHRMKHLRDIGTETAELAALGRSAEVRELTDEELFRASDAVIDLMKASWLDDETLKSLSRPIKDSSDKVGLMNAIKGVIMKALSIST